MAGEFSLSPVTTANHRVGYNFLGDLFPSILPIRGGKLVSIRITFCKIIATSPHNSHLSTNAESSARSKWKSINFRACPKPTSQKYGIKISRHEVGVPPNM
ncbi:hypothetical protein PIB30_003145 [Stylosanthes scabra]|uniref:Uncharacterized protein n=1 Tax=Stylosanthes scabra TaxID=79078 RepID=A0ABU6Z2X7_9FABA|nr:hypothetical protein [Stylosanthes scabra]